MDVSENLESDNFGSYDALLIAFKTMKERCQQFQNRLATVEEENMFLRFECGKDLSTAIVKTSSNNEKTILMTLQEKVEELTKEKSQLTHHIFMVAAENRQLWSRLTRLKRSNKCLGNKLTKISDTLKEHPPTQPSDILAYSFKHSCDVIKSDVNEKPVVISENDDREQSLEEISLKLINSIMLEKSDLEQQYTEMVEMQNNSELNLQNVGFTYPEDSDTDPLEQLKQHDIKLYNIKQHLKIHQTKLKRILQNFENMKKESMCSNCRKNANKIMCQVGTQFNSDDSFTEHGATQTSLSASSLPLDKCFNSTDSNDTDYKICPLCGVVKQRSVSFAEFHEHVLSHFTKDVSFQNFDTLN